MTLGTGPGAAASGREDGVWTVLRMMLWSAEYLASKGVDRARLDAEYLLSHALGMDRLQLYLQHERPLMSEELDRYRPLLKRRAGREPLQYILGRAAFRELDLLVRPGVLIPRPETEILVGEVLDWAKATGRTDLAALDVGTGSGAIALSLAFEGPFERVVAVDVSAEALEIARANAVECSLFGRVVFRLGSLFGEMAGGETFDVVVSNPPYVAESEMPSLQPEVREWEPKEALVSGPDGLTALRAIVAGATTCLRPGGMLALEVGHGQAGAVVACLQNMGEYDDVRVRKDLTGRERVVLSRRTLTN